MSWRPLGYRSDDVPSPLSFDVDTPLSPHSADQQSRALLDQVRQRRQQRQKAQLLAGSSSTSLPNLSELAQKHVTAETLAAKTSVSGETSLALSAEDSPAIVLTPAGLSPSIRPPSSSTACPALPPSQSSPLPLNSYSDSHRAFEEDTASEGHPEPQLEEGHRSRQVSLDSTDIRDLTRSGTIKLVLPHGKLVDGLNLDFNAPSLLQRHGVDSVSTSAAPLPPSQQTPSHFEHIRKPHYSAPPRAGEADPLTASSGTRSTSGTSQPHSDPHSESADLLFSPALRSQSSLGGSTSDGTPCTLNLQSTDRTCAAASNMTSHETERDILDIIQDIKQEKSRERAAIKMGSGTGRRTYIGQAVDIHGEAFATLNTSLSPITEKTERSSKSGGSTISTFRDSMASKAGYMTSAERHASQMSALSGLTSINQPSQQQQQQSASTRSSRIISPVFTERTQSKIPVREAEEEKEEEPSQSTPKWTAEPPIKPSPMSSNRSQKSTAELIELFNGKTQQDQKPSSPAHSPRKRPVPTPQQPSTQRSRTQSPDSFGSLRPRHIPSLQEWVTEVDAEAKRRKTERRQRSQSEADSIMPSSSAHRSGSGASFERHISHSTTCQSTRDSLTIRRQEQTAQQTYKPLSAPAAPSAHALSQNHTSDSKLRSNLSAVSTNDTIFTLPSDVDILHHGELFYAPPSALTDSGCFRWRSCRAVLIPGNLLVSYDDGSPMPVERRLKLTGCTIVKSVRLPRSASETEQEHFQAFKLQWTNGKVEHFACKKATERVHWLSSILDTLDFSSCATSLAEPVNERDQVMEEEDNAHTPCVNSPVKQEPRKPSYQQLPPDQLEQLLHDVEQMTAFTDSASNVDTQLDGTSSEASSELPPGMARARQTPLPPVPPKQVFDPLGYAPSSSSFAPARSPNYMYQSDNGSASTDSLRRYALKDPGTSPGAPMTRSPLSPRASMRRRALAQQVLSRQQWSPRKRGAWSDSERASVQSEAALLGPASSRALARDMRRLLNLLERKDSTTVTQSSQQLHLHLQDIEDQLMGIAGKLKGHEDDLYDPENSSDADPEQPVPNLADKVDYMIKLSQILKESQDKVSAAVEAKLRNQGVHLEGPASPSISETDSSALKTVALTRIEHLLGTVLSRLENQHSSESARSQPTPQHREGPNSAIEDPPMPRSSTSTIPESELLALRNQPSLQPHSSNDPMRHFSAQSSPRSDRFILDEREKARQKLERHSGSQVQDTQPVTGEKSHWSNDTAAASGMNPTGQVGSLEILSYSGHQSSQTLTQKKKMPPTPTRSREPAFETPMFHNSSTQSDLSLSQPPSQGPDPETMTMLQNILHSMQEQTKITDANTSYQREVGEYLSRFDEYLRKEAANRKQDWRTMTENLTQLERKVSLLAKSPRKASRGSLRSRKEESNAERHASSAGSILRRVSSRRNASEEKYPDESPKDAERLQSELYASGPRQPRGVRKVSLAGSKRKRSISLPRFGGEGLRIWGAPNPTGDPEKIWGPRPALLSKRPSLTKKSAPSLKTGLTDSVDEITAGTKFDTLEAALASYGQAQTHKPPGLGAPTGPRMPPSPPRSKSQQSTRTSRNHKAADAEYEEAYSENEEDGTEDKPTPKGVLAAMKNFMAQLMDHQRREEERDKLAEARYQELLTRTAEPSPVETESQMEEKSQAIERQRQDEKLHELIGMLREKSEQHDSLLREIAQSVSNQQAANIVNSPSQEDMSRLLAALADGVNVQVNDFKNNMSVEVKKALEDVAALREQKKGLQHDIAELMSFKAKNLNGAPDMQPHYASGPAPRSHNGGQRSGGAYIGPGAAKYSPFGRVGGGPTRLPPPPNTDEGNDQQMQEGVPPASGQSSRFGIGGFGAFGPRAPART